MEDESKMEKNRNNPSVKKELNVWDLSSLGIEFGFILVIFVVAGIYVDDYFSFSPFATIGGAFIGFAYGIYYLVYRTREPEK